MMQRQVKTGPRLTKRQREKAANEKKADAALGGAVMEAMDGEDEKVAKVPHWFVELQWFRLLRGQKRLDQIARILVELAPEKVFDPRVIWEKSQRDGPTASEAAAAAAAALAAAPPKAPVLGKNGRPKREKKPKKPKKLSKKEEMIAKNKARKEKKDAALDREKVKTLGSKASAGIKLKTDSGKLLLLLNLLKEAVKRQNVVDALDTLWEIEEVASALSPEDSSAALKPFHDTIKIATAFRTDKKALGGQPLVHYQLTKMADRLPPLSLHSMGKFKLDPWQAHVLKLITEKDSKKSVLITAPTSSGKTVLSTFVCTSGAQVLFVVPTEPLAWQVAAMMNALRLNIALVVPTLSYVPSKYEVVVGTPHALESVLTKRIGFDFDWAIFDEVHSLNSFDGQALQRLIKIVPSTCRFLALSATIGNADELKRWWTTIVGEGNIELVNHRARFINLQRHVWVPEQNSLVHLHPCVSLDPEFLRDFGFDKSDVAFTPEDTFQLWEALEKVCGKAGKGGVTMEDLDPVKWLGGDAKVRVTLADASRYETVLKSRLVDLARGDLDAAKAVLSHLGKGSVVQAASNPEAQTTTASIVDLFFELRKKEYLPGIVFQLDSVRCQGYFDAVLKEIEEREEAAYPEYRADLLRKQASYLRNKDRLMKKGQRKNEDDDSRAEGQAFGDSGGSVDVDEPHKEFTLTPPGKGMGSVEAADTQAKLKGDLPMSGDDMHPLVRALRRGIGVYITGLPSVYLRTVQALAQRGRLGIVFSDELLAYGVNMPFRAAVFCGDTGGDWLTQLLYQQMAGRAGRRGLDRQGHLVYAGFSNERLHELLRGVMPRVIGRYPLYPTVPLQLAMNERFKTEGKPLTKEAVVKVCDTPLEQFLTDAPVDGYFDTATQWMENLGVLDHPSSSYAYLVPEMVWELRQFLPESLAIQYLLEPLIREFRFQAPDSRDRGGVQQTKVFQIFCRICAREPFNADDADGEGFVGALPSPHTRDTEWDKWTDLLNQSQARIAESELPYKENMLLPVAMDVPLDNQCYVSFVRNQIDPKLSTVAQYNLRQRLYNVGEVLRIMTNILGRSEELKPIQNLIRKAFIRIRYILDETFQRNWRNWQDSGNAVDDLEGLDEDGADAGAAAEAQGASTE